jgi:hypothetical protein
MAAPAVSRTESVNERCRATGWQEHWTADGERRARCRAARWKHGLYSKEALAHCWNDSLKTAGGTPRSRADKACKAFLRVKLAELPGRRHVHLEYPKIGLWQTGRQRTRTNTISFSSHSALFKPKLRDFDRWYVSQSKTVLVL